MDSSKTEEESDRLILKTRWATQSETFLSNFILKYKLPRLAKVVKGQYLSVGSSKSLFDNQHISSSPYLLVYCKQSVRKLVGRVVKWRDNKCLGCTNQRAAINELYTGYFELLSEDGLPIKCLESVNELIDVFPDTCIVRQQCKAYLPDMDGELRSMYRSRCVREGEILTLVGRFHYKHNVFLRCFDENGKSVFLKANRNHINGTKCRFSPVVKSEEAISGAHSIASLMKKRLPLTVRLITGHIESEIGSGGSSIVIRLESLIQQDEVFVYSFGNKLDHGKFMSIPLNAHLKLASSANQSQLNQDMTFRELIAITDRVLANFYDTFDKFVDHDAVADERRLGQKLAEEASPTADDDNFVIDDKEIEVLYDYVRGVGRLPRQSLESGQYQQDFTMKTASDETNKTSKCSDHNVNTKRDSNQKRSDYNYRQVAIDSDQSRLSRSKMYSKSIDKLACIRTDQNFGYKQPAFASNKVLRCINNLLTPKSAKTKPTPSRYVDERSYNKILVLPQKRVLYRKNDRPYKSCNTLIQHSVEKSQPQYQKNDIGKTASYARNVNLIEYKV